MSRTQVGTLFTANPVILVEWTPSYRFLYYWITGNTINSKKPTGNMLT